MLETMKADDGNRREGQMSNMKHGAISNMLLLQRASEKQIFTNLGSRNLWRRMVFMIQKLLRKVQNAAEHLLSPT